jgi:tRNA-uridine 2-sulfurtransferase
MFSGGLDSIISAQIMRNEGFEVIAIHFYTGFNGNMARDIAGKPGEKWTPGQSVVDAARKLDITLMPIDVSVEYHDIILNPRYGYGSAANPCIDCRIFLLIKAREVMEAEGAILVFTGEVLGQRPMSQHRNSLRQVEKRSGLKGRLLRPLSAKLLDPTIPEKEGLVNRDHLYDIQGRSRKPQQELADTFGIDWYPSSGGGCLLTYKQFSKKFDDLLAHSDRDKISLNLLCSLKTGRHIRLESGVKIIVGRCEVENDYLMTLLSPYYWYFEARDFEGPTVFATDEPAEEDFAKIAAITARYGKGRDEESVAVIAKKGDEERVFEVTPSKPEETEKLLIC